MSEATKAIPLASRLDIASDAEMDAWVRTAYEIADEAAAGKRVDPGTLRAGAHRFAQVAREHSKMAAVLRRALGAQT